MSTDDAIDNVDTSIAQAVANTFLPCLQPSDNIARKLDKSTNNPVQPFELLAVDSLPKDAASTTDTCTAEKSSWTCVVVQGAVTAYSSSLDQFDLNAVLRSIETSSLNGSLNLPNGKLVVTYLSPTTITEPIQQAPALPQVTAARDQEQSPSSSRPPNYVYGIAVAAAFVGSVAFAFLVFRYRQRLPSNGALQADREGNLEPPEHQDVNIGPSQYEYPTRGSGGGAGGGDAASYVSEDTFWRSIMGKRTRESSSNYQPRNSRFESDASVALSSIGASFKGALGFGLEDDIDIESCGSSTMDDPSCLAEVAASYDDDHGGQDDGRGKKWIDRLGIFANPK